MKQRRSEIGCAQANAHTHKHTCALRYTQRQCIRSASWCRWFHLQDHSAFWWSYLEREAVEEMSECVVCARVLHLWPADLLAPVKRGRASLKFALYSSHWSPAESSGVSCTAFENTGHATTRRLWLAEVFMMRLLTGHWSWTTVLSFRKTEMLPWPKVKVEVCNIWEILKEKQRRYIVAY